MDSCTESGCEQAARWAVDGRRLCRSHAVDRMGRTGHPAVVLPAAAEDRNVWDELQAELEAIPFDGLDDTGRRLREIAWSAIENGREAAAES